MVGTNYGVVCHRVRTRGGRLVLARGRVLKRAFHDYHHDEKCVPPYTHNIGNGVSQGYNNTISHFHGVGHLRHCTFSLLNVVGSRPLNGTWVLGVFSYQTTTGTGTGGGRRYGCFGTSRASSPFYRLARELQMGGHQGPRARCGRTNHLPPDGNIYVGSTPLPRTSRNHERRAFYSFTFYQDGTPHGGRGQEFSGAQRGSGTQWGPLPTFHLYQNTRTRGTRGQSGPGQGPYYPRRHEPRQRSENSMGVEKQLRDGATYPPFHLPTITGRGRTRFHLYYAKGALRFSTPQRYHFTWARGSLLVRVYLPGPQRFQGHQWP